MSDNVPPDEVKKRLILFLRIPSETWTDVLKLLPRRKLVQNISPACYRLKEISDKNVNNVHMITEADRFNAKLEDFDPEAEQQLKDLAANSCKLANHFRLTELSIFDKNKTIIRHCLDLFHDCKVVFFPMSLNQNPAFIEEYLNILEVTKPVAIHVGLGIGQFTKFHTHPTILNCCRVAVSFFFKFNVTASAAILEWLHHKPTVMAINNNNDGAGAVDVQQEQQQVRCMILHFGNHDIRSIDKIFNQCVQNLHESQAPEDRRQFVITFSSDRWNGLAKAGRIENQSTGETLMLEPVIGANGRPSGTYRLRRCLTQEAESGKEFYGSIFKRNVDGPMDAFNIDEAGAEVFVE